MLIYLDESYDRRARYMCLGALFLPDDGPSNAQMETIKDKYRQFAPGHSFSDLKYARSGDKFTSALCREIIDLFIIEPGWFRCLVIDTALPGFSWGVFGGWDMPRSVTKARAYGRLTELLLEPNLRGIEDAVLLADALTEVPGDDFVQYISERFGAWHSLAVPAPTRIRHVHRVDTSLPRYRLGQMCDILLGVVTGGLVRPANLNKLELIEYAQDILGLPGFGPEYWPEPDDFHPNQPIPKFHIWHWRAK